MKTDELVKIIVSEIGVALPTFNYKLGKYRTEIPINMVTEKMVAEKGAIGIDAECYFSDFNEACQYIYDWAIKANLIQEKPKFSTPQQKSDSFKVELKELLSEYNAELTLEDLGSPFILVCEDTNIVVDFAWDKSFIDAGGDNGIVPNIVLGRNFK